MNGKGILIVEDENIVALDMKMRLESLGYTVLGVVDNGISALNFLFSQCPDLVLMDIKLKGGTDGIETAKAARERVEVPIIFVTAFTDEATLERAKLASPYGYIVKPFHERELRIAIELALYKFQYELTMRRSKELAEEANRAKGEFLANVSHELKTPLNSVIGFTELSLDHAADEEQREYLQAVLRSARSLVQLIDSVLDFAKLENGQMAPNAVTFSLEDFLDECVDFLVVRAKSKGLEVSFREDADVPDAIIGDKSRFSQILTNLLDNAVKFTERGRVRLHVEVAKGPAISSPAPSPPRNRGIATSEYESIDLRFVIEDTGIGISEDQIPKAFERFTQLDGSTTRAAGGTGLGLAIVSKSVELLGGSISVKSASGEGSNFAVSLPVQIDKSSPDHRSQILAGRTFSIVGFSKESRQDIGYLLSRLGAKEVLFFDAIEACEGHCDFLLADEAAAKGLLDSTKRPCSGVGRFLVAVSPGFSGRSSLAAIGASLIAHPVRAKSLLKAIAETKKAAISPASAPLSPLKRSEKRDSSLDLRELDPGSASEKGHESFSHFVSAFASALGNRDFAAIEREAKEFRELFLDIGADTYERLAFSILLLARKADEKGLEEVLDRVRRLVDLDVAHVNGGGK